MLVNNFVIEKQLLNIDTTKPVIVFDDKTGFLTPLKVFSNYLK